MAFLDSFYSGTGLFWLLYFGSLLEWLPPESSAKATREIHPTGILEIVAGYQNEYRRYNRRRHRLNGTY